jgi:ATP-binding cassette subfamily F protein uup
LPKPTNCWRKRKSDSQQVEARRTRSGPNLLEVLAEGCANRDARRGRSVNLDVSSGEKSGKIVAELTDVEKL